MFARERIEMYQTGARSVVEKVDPPRRWWRKRAVFVHTGCSGVNPEGYPWHGQASQRTFWHTESAAIRSLGQPVGN